MYEIILLPNSLYCIIDYLFCLFSEFNAIIVSIMERKIRTVSLIAEAHWTLPEPQGSAFTSGPVQIVISNMPTDNVTLGHLEFFLEQFCGMPDDGSSSLERREDGSVLVSFTSNPSKTGMLCVKIYTCSSSAFCFGTLCSVHLCTSV